MTHLAVGENKMIFGFMRGERWEKEKGGKANPHPDNTETK
jgi:hypothetical protein